MLSKLTMRDSINNMKSIVKHKIKQTKNNIDKISPAGERVQSAYFSPLTMVGRGKYIGELL